MIIHTCEQQGVMELAEAILTQSIDDYKLCVSRGWLSGPFQINEQLQLDRDLYNRVTQANSSMSKKQEAVALRKELSAQFREQQAKIQQADQKDMLNIAECRELLLFLTSDSFERMLFLADSPIDAKRVRKELVKIYEKLSPKSPLAKLSL